MNGTDEVTINVGRVHAAVTVYDPTVGTDPVKTLANVEAIRLTLSDHPLVPTIPRE